MSLVVKAFGLVAPIALLFSGINYKNGRIFLANSDGRKMFYVVLHVVLHVI